jgi:Rod binding domain-containing protein
MGTMIGAGSLMNQTSLLQAREDRMLGQLQSLKGGSGGDKDAKIEKGAMEFESMLLSSWLQQAEQSMATVPGADDDEDAAGKEQMMSLGTQQMAASMAASGGIGIAKMIAKSMHAAEIKAEASNGLPSDPKGTKVSTVKP